MKNTLIYVHDPMCSWCWGFENMRQKLFDAVADNMHVRRLLGGLAPDSDEPMPDTMRLMLQQTWQRVEQLTGQQFNFDFWQKCKPRRSTFPANRAVIAAREQGAEFDQRMTERIQQAYYREARNPSDNATLIDLATDIGLDRKRFSESLDSESTHQQLQAEIQSARSIGVDSFPSLVVEHRGNLRHVMVSYTDLGAMLHQIEAS